MSNLDKPRDQEAVTTYVMTFRCTNCTTYYNKVIKKGTLAKGSGDKCPYCGTRDYGSFGYFKPSYSSSG